MWFSEHTLNGYNRKIHAYYSIVSDAIISCRLKQFAITKHLNHSVEYHQLLFHMPEKFRHQFRVYSAHSQPFHHRSCWQFGWRRDDLNRSIQSQFHGLCFRRTVDLSVCACIWRNRIINWASRFLFFKINRINKRYQTAVVCGDDFL